MQVLTIVLVASIACYPAWGYIDPGTGSLLLQLQLAFAAGLLFYFKRIKTSVVAFFTRKKTSASETRS